MGRFRPWRFLSLCCGVGPAWLQWRPGTAFDFARFVPQECLDELVAELPAFLNDIG